MSLTVFDELPVRDLAVEMTFDRGTILLRSSRRPPLDTVSGCVWDERVGAYRAPAWCYRELARALPAKGYRIADSVSYGWGNALALIAPELRPYQTAALTAWTRAGSSGVVVLPTGAGKTRLGMAAIASTGRSAICLVPTKVLLEQWHALLRSHFKIPIGILGDGKQELSPILVATFESAYRYMSWLGNRFQLMVIDEAHHFGAGVRDEALEMCIAPHRLGLTATPLTKGEARFRLEELIGPQVYEATIGELTGRYLAPFEHVTLHLDLYSDERAYYEREMRLFRLEFDRFQRDYRGAKWADFAAWAQQRWEGRRALLALRNARRCLGAARAKEESLEALLTEHAGSKVLVFTADTGAAYHLSRRMLIHAITSDIKKAEREDVIDKFRRGIIRSLVSCRVLNEGIDVPDAEVAIILGGNQGEREHIQRIGRCLRPADGKVAKVYELVAKDTMEVRHWQRRTETLAPRIFA